MAKTSGKYELLYIVAPDKTEEERTAVIEKFRKLIADNGTIDAEEEWGMRKLAYLIDDKAEGYYVLVQFTSAPDFPAELDRVLKINHAAGIMRALITARGE